MICFYRYIAEQALEDGVNSEVFMCGMQAVEESARPSSHIFECDPLLSCGKPVEVGFHKASGPFMAAEGFVMGIICVGTSDDAGG